MEIEVEDYQSERENDAHHHIGEEGVFYFLSYFVRFLHAVEFSDDRGETIGESHVGNEDEGDDIVGIDADIAQAICDKLGYELKIEDMEFDAIIAAVSSGKADFGAAGMTVTEDRLKNIDFTDTYATASQVIVVRNK